MRTKTIFGNMRVEGRVIGQVRMDVPEWMANTTNLAGLTPSLEAVLASYLSLDLTLDSLAVSDWVSPELKDRVDSSNQPA